MTVAPKKRKTCTVPQTHVRQRSRDFTAECGISCISV
jgi:hypothetical protein